MTYQYKLTLHLICGLLILLQHLSAQARPESAVGSKYRTYVLGREQCTLQLSAKDGGQVHNDERVEFSGFSDEVGKNFQSLTFTFHCLEDARGKYCQDEWLQELVLEDPSTVKIMKVIFYKNINPGLGAIVYAANTNAVALPRPRSVRYCFSNGKEAVEGVVFVGNEKSSQAWRAIKILKTLQFN